MNIKDWFRSATDMERAQVAECAETTVAYLQQLVGGHRLPSKKLAERLEEATAKHTPQRVISKFEAVFPDQTTQVA